jgi:hypothetical protein
MKRQVAAQLLLDDGDSPLNKSTTFKTVSFIIENTTEYDDDVIHQQNWSRSPLGNRLRECSAITR